MRVYYLVLFLGLLLMFTLEVSHGAEGVEGVEGAGEVEKEEALDLSLRAVDAYESGDLELAERLYRESIPLYELLEDDSSLAMTYHGIGLSYELRGDISGARSWFLRSLEINEERGFARNSARNYISLGGLWLKEGVQLRACGRWREALVRLEAEGISGGVTRVEGWLRDLNCPLQ
ncbi:MAG: tetratricopeptide repeat protein [Alphaproteobacteria bacterium]